MKKYFKRLTIMSLCLVCCLLSFSCRAADAEYIRGTHSRRVDTDGNRLGDSLEIGGYRIEIRDMTEDSDGGLYNGTLYINGLVADNGTSTGFISDGKYVFYSKHVAGGKDSIWRMSLDTLEKQQMLEDDDIIYILSCRDNFLYYLRSDEAKNEFQIMNNDFIIYDLDKNTKIYSETNIGVLFDISDSLLLMRKTGDEFLPMTEVISMNNDGTNQRLLFSDKQITGYKINEGKMYYATDNRQFGTCIKSYDFDSGKIETLTNSYADANVSVIETDHAEFAVWYGNIEEYYSDNAIKVEYGGKDIAFEHTPITQNETVIAPLRELAEALGALVSWNEETMTASVEKDGVILTFPVGNLSVYKNGEEIATGRFNILIDDKAYVPVRLIAESFGMNVDWNENTKTVILKTNN